MWETPANRQEKLLFDGGGTWMLCLEMGICFWRYCKEIEVNGESTKTNVKLCFHLLFGLDDNIKAFSKFFQAYEKI